ncbi:hypothetical protein PIB30_087819, partial [Stylosanthes scabra]|nr:hypothetical protein [Stylosanthes scabra]
PVGIEKCIGKAKEGIRNKGSMKRSKEGEFWNSTRKLRTQLLRNREHFGFVQTNVAYATP